MLHNKDDEKPTENSIVWKNKEIFARGQIEVSRVDEERHFCLLLWLKAN